MGEIVRIYLMVYALYLEDYKCSWFGPKSLGDFGGHGPKSLSDFGDFGGLMFGLNF